MTTADVVTSPVDIGVLSVNLLSTAQCTALVRDFGELPKIEGTLFRGDAGMHQVDVSKYKATEAYLDLRGQHAWLCPMLQRALDQASEWFDCSTMGVFEPPRVLRYRIGGHFAWHTDAPPFGVTGVPRQRRLTMSVQLSGADDYRGGELLIKRDGRTHRADRTAGNVVLFPANWVHAAQPVTFGTRYALVLWGASL
ncbi:MAG: 2OG-Fe(II) oxygenase [Burkholderiales bacterium]|nr:2OG-Fe(II) oxygenase [Burkholderiales bacterium]